MAVQFHKQIQERLLSVSVAVYREMFWGASQNYGGTVLGASNNKD